ncbi:G patch domain-containing protein 11 [Actinomortierella ambigua]|nr:G patch domain-containing protein 11 [Actinomortierella ambigua]
MADEDDYMSEAFLAQFEEAEKTSKKNKTYTERRRQKEREHLANQIKSHKERELESRTKGLETEIGEENKGMQMLLKMGFKKGGTLGASSTGNAGTMATSTDTTIADAKQGSPLQSLTTSSVDSPSRGLIAPLAIEIKQGRSGLGMDTLLKEQEEQMLQEKRAFDEHFRERKGDQYLNDKYHRQLTRAQSLCMELDLARYRKEKEKEEKEKNESKEQQQQEQEDQQQHEGEQEVEKDQVASENAVDTHQNSKVEMNPLQPLTQEELTKHRQVLEDHPNTPPAELSRGNAFWWIADDVPDDIIGTRAMGRPAEVATSTSTKSDTETAEDTDAVNDVETVGLGHRRRRRSSQTDHTNKGPQDETETGWTLSALQKTKKRKLEGGEKAVDTGYANDSDDDVDQPQEEESSPPLWGEYPEFASLEVKDKRDKVVEYLRNQHAYCFWCHAQYADSTDLELHCPGPLEDDH